MYLSLSVCFSPSLPPSLPCPPPSLPFSRPPALPPCLLFLSRYQLLLGSKNQGWSSKPDFKLLGLISSSYVFKTGSSKRDDSSTRSVVAAQAGSAADSAALAPVAEAASDLPPTRGQRDRHVLGQNIEKFCGTSLNVADLHVGMLVGYQRGEGKNNGAVIAARVVATSAEEGPGYVKIQIDEETGLAGPTCRLLIYNQVPQRLFAVGNLTAPISSLAFQVPIPCHAKPPQKSPLEPPPAPSPGLAPNLNQRPTNQRPPNPQQSEQPSALQGAVLGQDVTQIARLGVSCAVDVNSLVGVRRTSGNVTLGRVEHIGSDGFAKVSLGGDGFKTVPLAELFTVPLPQPNIVLEQKNYGMAKAGAAVVAVNRLMRLPHQQQPQQQQQQALVLGQDVTLTARLGVNIVAVNSLVGVRRSNGHVTLARVQNFGPGGIVQVLVGPNDVRNVPREDLYSVSLG